MSRKWHDRPSLPANERKRRLMALRAITVTHPRWIEFEDLILELIAETDALIEINDALREEGKKRGIKPMLQPLFHIPLIGPSGATKSTTLGLVMNKINARAPEGQAPIAYISLSESIRSTKALYMEFFRVFGDTSNMDNLRTTLSTPNAHEIEEAIIRVARARGTKVVFLDEVHNLLVHDAGKVGAAMAQALKGLLNQSVFSLVLAGTEEVERLFQINSELAGRVYEDVGLGRLRIEYGSERTYFFKFVQNYEARLVKDRVLNARYGLTDDVRTRAKIYEAADGVIGVVVRILRIAVRAALAAGRTKLTDDDLADAVWTYWRRTDKNRRNPFVDGPDEKILKHIRASQQRMQPA